MGPLFEEHSNVMHLFFLQEKSSVSLKCLKDNLAVEDI